MVQNHYLEVALKILNPNEPKKTAYPSSPIRSMLATLAPAFPFLIWKSTFRPATWWQVSICSTYQYFQLKSALKKTKQVMDLCRKFSHLQKLNRLTSLVWTHGGNVVFQNTPEITSGVLNKYTKVNKNETLTYDMKHLTQNKLRF